MHNRKVQIMLLVLSPLVLLPLTVAAQAAKASAQEPEYTFAGVQAALIHAADTTLSNAVVTKPEMQVVDHQSDALSGASMPPSDARRTNARLNTLRPLVEPLLTREGVPAELAAVIQIESSGNPLALSPKGARGLWQLMPETARRYGLKVDQHIDERIDVEKSTTVAARYLRDLYAQFGSWPLALAAYNTGEQNLQRAISRTGSREFSTLSFLGRLPAETREYVPAVLAAMGTPSLPASRRIVARQPDRVYALMAQ